MNDFDECMRRWGPRKLESEETRKLRAERSSFQNEMESLQNVMWNNMAPSSSPRNSSDSMKPERFMWNKHRARAAGRVEKHQDK